MSHRDHVQLPTADQVQAPSVWGLLMWGGAGVGVIGLAASLLLRGGNEKQFAFSWLVAFLFFLSIALGGLFFVLTHFATKARWSVVVRRLAEDVMATLPLFAVLFLPVFFGIHELFHWSHPEEVAADHLLQVKEPFLNVGFFKVRAAIYFVVWIALAFWFLRGSQQQDTSGDPAITNRLIKTRAPGLLLFALTVTFASIDWIMSLDPHWYSTMFGVYYFAGCLVGIFSVMCIVAVLVRRSGVMGQVITLEHLQDLGKLLFAFTVFWAYIGFSQYFLIWYGNIPEETLFFAHRSEGAWKSVSMLLGWGHFGVPFLFLMSRHIKRRPALLVAGSVWMLFMQLVDIYWLVMPTLHHHTVHVTLLDFTCLLAVGGLFLAALSWQVQRRALVPVRDPRLPASLSFENF